MATARPFAYNIGAPIAGTEQVGSLAVGYPTAGFVGIPWWNGPDEELGYVIAQSVPGNTQRTPVFSSSPLTLSSTYRGTDIVLSNSNQTAYQQFGYQQSVLGQTFLNNNDKVMFSVSLSLASPPTLTDSHFVGFGTTSMNYQGNPYGAFPGNDNQSIGIGSAGDYYFNGAVQATGLPTFGNGDVIDVAVDLGNNKIWIRVNGGNWNGSPTQNPATGNGSLGIGGLTSFYPVLCPGYEGTMTVQNSATYGVPNGFKLLGTNVNASVGFLRSPLLTESSFVDLANYVAAGATSWGPTGGTAAKAWLNSNGYWTSWTDTWQYDAGNNLPWTDDTTGYTLLTGGVTAVDDGYWVNPITIPTYYTNNQTSSSLYISTNAVVTLGVGYGACCPSSPQTSSNPALISGNAGDMYANPGVALTDGTIMNAYYKITQNGDKTKIELKVFQAILSAQNSPYSYQLNLYRDSTYQWVETRVKTGIAGNVGPYNAIDVSQPASQTSRVWRGDLLGQNWVYLGTGTVII